MDALVYAETSNILPNSELINLNINFQGNQSPQDVMNQYLNETTIKRACCMNRTGPANNDGSTGVNVKIPIPTNYNFQNELNPALNKQFGYIEKTVYVPQSLCDQNWKKFTPYCDNFMEAYCTNQYKVFSEILGTPDQGSIWPNYLKECSCFAPPNNSFGAAPKNCYMMGCQGGDTDVYLSSDSRDNNGNPLTCDMTICNSIVNASNITAGGSANFNPVVMQNCGQQIKQAKAEMEAQKEAMAAAKAKAEAALAEEEAEKKNTSGGGNLPSKPSNGNLPNNSPNKPQEEDINKKPFNYVLYVILPVVVLCIFLLLFVYIKNRNAQN